MHERRMSKAMACLGHRYRESVDLLAKMSVAGTRAP